MKANATESNFREFELSAPVQLGKNRLERHNKQGGLQGAVLSVRGAGANDADGGGFYALNGAYLAGVIQQGRSTTYTKYEI